MDFPGGSVVKNLPANAGDVKDKHLIAGRRSPGEGHGNPSPRAVFLPAESHGRRSLVVHGVRKS